ncbi:MAG TPA: hypothetical protein VM100_04805, partial [Longimicrobiales bacterium]|nr:hypothetical protein [Longimicrobiales bacterium]
MRSPASKSKRRRGAPHSLAAIALILFLATTAQAQEAALSGVWASESFYGPALRGVLTVESGAEWRATILSAETRFQPAGDSVHFAFQGGLGEFRGTLNKARTAIRGFWIQEMSVALGYRMSTPLTLRLSSPNIFHGDVVPLDDRYTLYINFWRSPSAGFVASIRNPDQNDRFHLFVFSVKPQRDSVIFSARPDTTQPERRFAAAYDSARGELRVDWLPANRTMMFRKRAEAEPVAIYPRTPRGLTYTYRKPEQTSD